MQSRLAEKRHAGRRANSADKPRKITRSKSRETNVRDSDKDMGTERLLARLAVDRQLPMLKVSWALSTLSELIAKNTAELAELANSRCPLGS